MLLITYFVVVPGNLPKWPGPAVTGKGQRLYTNPAAASGSSLIAKRKKQVEGMMR